MKSNKELISENRTIIMGLAMISIILFHQPWFSNHIVDDIFHRIGYFGVDFFLFVSGFGIANSLQRNGISTFYFNRVRRLLPYCIIYGGIKACSYYYGIHGFTPNFHPSIALVSCCLDLWYIEAIVIYYLLAPIINVAIKKFGGTFFFVSILGAYFLSFIKFPENITEFLLFKRIDWVVERFPVFILGIYMFYNVDKYSSKILVIIGLIMVFFALCQTILPVFFCQRNVLLSVCLSVPGICLLFAKCDLFFFMTKLCPFVKWMGSNSLYIYLCHEFVFWSFYNHTSWSSNLYPCLLSLCSVFLVVFITNYCRTYFSFIHK